MALFDDLLPDAAPAAGGLFDDLPADDGTQRFVEGRQKLRAAETGIEARNAEGAAFGVYPRAGRRTPRAEKPADAGVMWEPVEPDALHSARTQMDVDLQTGQFDRDGRSTGPRPPLPEARAIPQSAVDRLAARVREATGSERAARAATGAADLGISFAKIGPQTGELAASAVQLLTGDTFGGDARAFFEERLHEMTAAQSEGARQKAARLAYMLRDPEVDAGQLSRWLVDDPEFLVNTALPSLGSMLVGAGAAGLGARMTGAAGATRGATAANVLMNAGDTFTETQGDLPSRYTAAAIAALGTLAAGKLAGGGAEAQIGRRTAGVAERAALRGALAENPVARTLAGGAQTGAREFGQESIEGGAQALGRQIGEGRGVDAGAVAKAAATEGLMGAVLGGAAGVAMDARAARTPGLVAGTMAERDTRLAQARAVDAAQERVDLDSIAVAPTVDAAIDAALRATARPKAAAAEIDRQLASDDALLARIGVPPAAAPTAEAAPTGTPADAIAAPAETLQAAQAPGPDVVPTRTAEGDAGATARALQPPPRQDARPLMTRDGLLWKANGQPWAERSRAAQAARSLGPGHEVAALAAGGWAIRRVAPADTAVPTQPAAPAAVDAGAHEAARSPRNDLPAPTRAQIEANNARLGHARIGGLEFSIENPEGSIRRDIRHEPPRWQVRMRAHYGYIRGSGDNTGEHVDAYVKPGTPADYAGPVYVVDQIDPQTGRFDEFKVMVGFDSQRQAEATYDAHFDDGSGPSRRGAVTALAWPQFRAWLERGDTTRPLAYVPTETRSPSAPPPKPAPPPMDRSGSRARAVPQQTSNDLILTERGTPFASRARAQIAADRLGRGHRAVRATVNGQTGWAIQPPSPRQIRASRPRPPGATVRNPVLRAIARAGGISRDHFRELTGERYTPQMAVRLNVHEVFTRHGRALDRVADEVLLGRFLSQADLDNPNDVGGTRAAAELISEAIRRRNDPDYRPPLAMADDEAEFARRQERYFAARREAEDAERDAEWLAEREAIAAEADALADLLGPSDVEALLDPSAPASAATLKRLGFNDDEIERLRADETQAAADAGGPQAGRAPDRGAAAGAARESAGGDRAAQGPGRRQVDDDDATEPGGPVLQDLGEPARRADDEPERVDVPERDRSGRALDGAELQALRRAAARLERPADGVFLRITDDGRAIATGPKGARIPEAFRRFAEDHGLSFVAQREGLREQDIPRAPFESGTNFAGIAVQSAPMPVFYREGGALYAAEMGDGKPERTGRTHFDMTPDEAVVETIDAVLPPAAQPAYVGTPRQLAAAFRKWDAGQISDDQFRLVVRDEIERRQDRRLLRGARVRGADWLRERLIRARRTGELSADETDLALWLIDRAPQVATDLGISIKDGDNEIANGTYNVLARIVTIFASKSNANTATHEILHHTERMMPADVQAGIRAEWLRQLRQRVAAAREKADAGQRAMLDWMLEVAEAGDDRLALTLWKGVGGKSLSGLIDYQYAAASEFWAVNAARILRERHEATSWIEHARQWLRELIAKARSLFGLSSDAAVIRGLEALLSGDGSFVTPSMISRLDGTVNEFADQLETDFDANPVNRFDLPDESNFRAVQRRLQDYLIRLKLVQDAIAGQGGMVGVAQDAYRAEERMHGRIQAQLDDFKNEHMRPLMKKLADAGLTPDDLALFAYALHAPERNAHIARANPALEGNGSGMTDAQAAAVLERFRRSGQYDALADAHRDLLAITRRTRRILVDAGLIPREQFERWESMYRHYVPLRGFEAVEFDADGNARFRKAGGIDVRGDEARPAHGRTTPAGRIIENIILDHERAIVRAERNAVAKVFLDLVTSNPDPALWEVDATRAAEVLGVDDRQLALFDVEQAARVPRPDEIDRGAQTIGVKVGGRNVYVKIHDPLLARALRRAYLDETGDLQRVIAENIGWYSNWIRNTVTRYNPLFVAVNTVRDAQTGALSTLDELGWEGVRRYARHYAGALAAAWRHERHGLDPEAREWDRWFREYKAAGAITGGFFMRDAGAVFDELRAELIDAGAAVAPRGEGLGRLADRAYLAVRGAPAARLAAATLRAVEMLGSASENAARVAAYRTARELGRSAAEAASIAKNLTTNFNRKGEWGTALNALYLFYNASVQGSARTFKALRSRNVQAVVAGMTAFAFALALGNAQWGGDDDDGEANWDKVPDFEKERNLIVMLPPAWDIPWINDRAGKAKYLKIPLPYGFNVFPVLGYGLADALRYAGDPRRGKSPAKVGIAIASALFGAFNPIGGSFDPTEPVQLGLAAAPTMLDLPIQLAAESNAFGRPVAPPRSDWDARPDSERYFLSDADTVQQRIARWLNAASGGDRARSGLIDVAPGTLETITRGATGGIGTFIADTLSTLSQFSDSAAAVNPRNVPFLRQFYGQADSRWDQIAFYENRREIERRYRQNLAAAKMGIAVDFADPENAAVQRMGSHMLMVNRYLAQLRRQELLVVEDRKLADRERRLKREAIDLERTALMRAFNRAFNDVFKPAAAGRPAPPPRQAERAAPPP